MADLGFVGLDDSDPDADPAVITGYKAARNRPLTRGQKLSNKALAAVRAPVEHGFAHLQNWRVLGKVRTDPRWECRRCRLWKISRYSKIALASSRRVRYEPRNHKWRENPNTPETPSPTLTTV